MKERITDKEYGYKKCRDCAYQNCQYCDDYAAIKEEEHNHLVEYEDAEEDGRLVWFPFKVGDTVYVPYNFKNEYGIATVEIEEIKIYDSKNNFMFFIDMGSDDEEFNQMYGYWKIGKSIGTWVFLNREEAEKRLEELKIKEY